MPKYPSCTLLALLLPCLVVQIAGCGSSGNAANTDSLAINLSATSLTVYPDNTSTQTLQATVTQASSSKQPIQVSITGLVPGLTVTPSQLTLQSGSPGTFTFLASTSAGSAAISSTGGTQIQNSPAVTVPLTIQATSGNASGNAALALTISGSNPGFVPDTTDLPVVQINTTAAAPVVSADDYLTGTFSITPGSANTTDVPYSGTMQIKGHGNTTWLMPKKPYKIKLDSKSKLLGMPSEKNWVLLANYDDKSLLRNAAALQAGNLVGLAWSPRSRFVELYLNGQYEGSYQLTEEIKIDSNRVNIPEMSTSDVSGDALTGGYLFEVDTANQPDDILFPISGVTFDLQDPDPAEPQQLSYLENYLQQASDALYSSNFTDPNTGYSAYLDTTSFIDWYLVEELFRNNDAVFWSSCWMYKNQDGKLFMGPLWDFDIAAGNVNFNGNASPTGWWLRSNTEPYPQWTERLFADPAYAAAVGARWNQVKPQFDTLPAWITQYATTLQQSQQNNFQRWPILGEAVWPNSEVAGSYQGEVDFLNSWLTQRIAWMDAQFNPPAAAKPLSR